MMDICDNSQTEPEDNIPGATVCWQKIIILYMP